MNIRSNDIVPQIPAQHAGEEQTPPKPWSRLDKLQEIDRQQQPTDGEKRVHQHRKDGRRHTHESRPKQSFQRFRINHRADAEAHSGMNGTDQQYGQHSKALDVRKVTLDFSLRCHR